VILQWSRSEQCSTAKANETRENQNCQDSINNRMDCICPATPADFGHQTIERFLWGGADAKAAWTWVAQYLFPPLTLIAGAWSVTASPGDRSKMSSPVIYWGAVFLSLFYIVVLYLVIGAQAGGEQTWQAVFEQSGLFLSLFEAFIIGWLGKLFIEIKR